MQFYVAFNVYLPCKSLDHDLLWRHRNLHQICSNRTNQVLPPNNNCVVDIGVLCVSCTIVHTVTPTYAEAGAEQTFC